MEHDTMIQDNDERDDWSDPAESEEVNMPGGLPPDELVERWTKITDGLAEHWKEPWTSIDHGDLLYDENGLPK